MSKFIDLPSCREKVSNFIKSRIDGVTSKLEEIVTLINETPSRKIIRKDEVEIINEFSTILSRFQIMRWATAANESILGSIKMTEKAFYVMNNRETI